MATLSNTSPDNTSLIELPTPVMPQYSQTSLPGIKRGIAIGVACSVSLILIAILAFLSIRRRNHILARKHQTEARRIEDSQTGPLAQERAWWIVTSPSLPPIETDARTIYELDATHITELSNNLDTQEAVNLGTSRRIFGEDGDSYAQKLHQWKMCNIALDEDRRDRKHDNSHNHLPFLTISPPGAAPDDISPLLMSPWDASPRTTLPFYTVSPLPDAHFPSGRYQGFVVEKGIGQT
ncbi:hypothetical protein EJ02DRAFT_451277 [Clathrospora elynae]|uniref:Uncharacterized protein n=1 Tax=Clathrospora elynae TaxID=706981 RepID=A0A6A5T2D9_9PLEO|nr:hypothetical protein EJ02DRAFT_451277 [Clathrospora elynae]